MTGPPPAGPPPPVRTWRDDPEMDEFELFRLVEPEAKKHGLPVDLVMRQIRQESTNRVRAVSPKGAQGLMQLMPATAASLGVTDPFDPVQNVKAGTRYLKTLWDKHKGNAPNAFAEYNGGAAAVDALKNGRPWKETTGYLGAILPSDQAPQQAPMPGQAPAAPVDEFEAFRQTLAPAPSIAPMASHDQSGARIAPYSPTLGERIEDTIQFGPLQGAASMVLHPVTNLPDIAAALGGRKGPAAAALGAGGSLARDVINTRVYGQPPPSGEEMLQNAAIEGVKQGTFSVVGNAVGGALRGSLGNAEAKTTAALNREAGLGLSIPEVLGDTKMGTTGRSLQRLSTRSLAGHTIAERARSAGEENARTAIELTLDNIAPNRTLGETGEVVKAGVKAGKAGRDVIGKQKRALEEQLPPVDIRAIKAAVHEVIERDIKGVATSFPRNKAEVDAVAAYFGGKANPTREAAIRAADAAQNPKFAQGAPPSPEGLLKEAGSTTTNSISEIMQRILNAEDTVPFADAAQFRTLVREAGGVPDQFLGTRPSGQSDKLEAAFTEVLGGQSKEWRRLSAMYGDETKDLSKAYVKQLVKTDPEAAIKAIKDFPSRAQTLKNILLRQAAHGPEAAEGKQAWDALRTGWMRQTLLKDAKKIPEAVAGVDDDLLKVMFSDAPGQAAVGRLKEIGTAMSKREDLSSQKLYEILTLGTAATTLATGHPIAAAGIVAATEGLPALLTWAMYSPRMSKLLVEGITAKQPDRMIGNLLRVGDAWLRHQKHPPKEAPPPPAAPTPTENARYPFRGAPPPSP